jgi:hypothetical protein
MIKGSGLFFLEVKRLWLISYSYTEHIVEGVLYNVNLALISEHIHLPLVGCAPCLEKAEC